MTDYPPPNHGEQTDEGVWFDSRPIPPHESYEVTHTPFCAVAGCDYDWTDQIGKGDAQTRLTWNADVGDWLCPRHVDEQYTPIERYPQPGERVWLETQSHSNYAGRATVHESTPDHWTIYDDERELEARLYIAVDDKYRLLDTTTSRAFAAVADALESQYAADERIADA